VNAPFRGRVARLRVKSAESVQAGQPLLDLVNPSALKAQIFVPASWISWLKPGASLTIVANNGNGYQAKVSKLNSRVDGVSQQLEVEALIESGEGLVPGMIGVASFNQPR
jgi:multidrug efflux pump subunit AcrA (membrane-fusion protein)